MSAVHPLEAPEPDEPLVTLSDVHCRVRRSRAGAERLVPRTELVFVRRGVFVTHFGSRRVVADPSRVLAVDGGSTVQFSHPTDDGDRYTAIELSGAAARELLGHYHPALTDRLRTPLPVNDLPVTPGVLLELHRLRRQLHRQARDTLAREETALRLAERVVRVGHRVTGRHRRPVPTRQAVRRELVERVREVLARDPAAALSLAALSAQVDATPFHLARSFREETGLPIHRYRLRLRLALALDRLADGEPNLSTLGFELGFSSQSHFTRHFRALYGRPPGQVRESLRGADTDLI